MTTRYRTTSTTDLLRPILWETNLYTGVVLNVGQMPAFTDSESHMWDEADGGRSVVKPCTHLSYVVEAQMWPTLFHSTDTSHYPNPTKKYDGYRGWSDSRTSPSGVLANSEIYIPVTGNSVDDLGKCVFDAYNKFITAVTALNASVSIAELGETPALFSLWQRRLSAPTNIVNGFLNYSFGWKPVFNDLVAVTRELRKFPATVRKRLKAIGDGEVVRHFKFRLDNTVDDLAFSIVNSSSGPQDWQKFIQYLETVNKSRVVVVTIRANVKPKLGPEGQELLNKLGALGLIPSLSTLWSITRLSFVVDWFYNIGGAIENLQGCLTHDVSNVRVCISDLRTRELAHRAGNANPAEVARIKQRYYRRMPTTVPKLPVLSYPRRLTPYLLLGALGLTQTKIGRLILSKGPKLNVDLNLSSLRTRLLRDRSFRKKIFGNRK